MDLRPSMKFIYFTQTWEKRQFTLRGGHQGLKSTQRMKLFVKQHISQKTIPVQCPVCDFTLRGTPKNGYRCLQCHCHYGTRFIRYIRREQLRTLLHTHFTPHKKTIEGPHTTTFQVKSQIPPIKNQEIIQTLAQTRVAIQESTQHLEDFLDLGQPDVLDRLKASAVQAPQAMAETPRHRKQLYSNTHVEKKGSRKTTTKKIDKNREKTKQASSKKRSKKVTRRQQ